MTKRLDVFGYSPEDKPEFTKEQKAEYGRRMRAGREAEGLTDGLRLGRLEFADYLARRRTADAQARGGRVWRPSR